MISIAGVSERDVDLLLLEEFLSSTEFQHWFLGELGSHGFSDASLLGAKRSVTQSTGESDLEITFGRPDGSKLLVLIENKVGSGFQPQQADRYRQRATTYLVQGRCSAAITVLVAPLRYLSATSETDAFDASLPYEKVRDWFDAHLFLGPRRHYKVSLLSAAIEKGTVGYQVVEDRPVTDFWHAYWRMAEKIAPELEMWEPPPKPAGAGFIYFRPRCLPRRLVDICHKLPHGNVDLQFRGMGERLREVAAVFEEVLEPGMSIQRANKSASVRIRVRPINTAEDFDSQHAAVIEGQRASLRLLRWFLTHQERVPATFGP